MSCRLCGAPGGRAFELRDRSYLDCPRCGYLQVAARHFPGREAELARYRLHRNDLGDPGYRGYLEAFLAALPALAPGARVLDFGSGPEPALSALLAERGARVEAYDPFFAPGEAWRRRSYEAILLHEVAEHLRYPGRSLPALCRRLEPGGLLALRTRFAPRTEAEFGAWWYREDPTHLGFYREASFEFLGKALGLELETLAPPDLALFRKPIEAAMLGACQAQPSSPASRKEPRP